MATQAPDKAAFAQLYYREALEAMLKRKGVVLPQHTTRSSFDPLNAMIEVMATDHHGLAILLDLVMAEASWPFATRRGSFVALGALTGYVPAQADVLFDVKGTPDPTTPVMEIGAVFGVKGSPRVRFESVEEVGEPGALDPAEHALTYDASEDTYTEWTGGDFGLGDPWQTGDALLFGHPVLMPNLAEFVTTIRGTDFAVVPEYYDNHRHRAAPDTVALSGGGTALEFTVPSWAGSGFVTPYAASLIEALPIRVTYKPTGVSQTVPASVTGLLSTGFFGQIAPSTNANDYEVSAAWLPFPIAALTLNVADGETDVYEWTIPDDVADDDRRWERATIEEVTAFWWRLRLTGVTGTPGTEPEWELPTAGAATWTGRVLTKQGETAIALPLGEASGEANMELDVGGGEVVEDGVEALYVDGDEWLRVDNLFTAGPSDLVWEEAEHPVSGRVSARFGDGTNGAIPPEGDAITADVRTGAQTDGNVGTGAINRLLGGAGGVQNIRNADPASGWQRMEAPDPENTVELLRTRRRGPADYRAIGRGLTPDDVRHLLTDPRARHGFTDRDGVSPIKRAAVIVEGSGPKTYRVVCVGDGGTTLTGDQLDDARAYLNGTSRYLESFGGRMVHNQIGDVANYTRDGKSFTITATVLAGLISTDAGAAEVRKTIMAVLDLYVDPLAPPLVLGGVDEWLWAVGEDMSVDLVKAAIGANLAGLVNLTVVINEGATISEHGLPDHERDSTTITLAGV